MAGAVIAAMVLSFLLPSGFGFALFWLFPLVEGLLLVAVVVADPGRIDRLGRGIWWLLAFSVS